MTPSLKLDDDAGTTFNGETIHSIDDFALRSDGTVQPVMEEYAGLQGVWDTFAGRQAGFHVGKQYGYGELGDLPGLVPYQDEEIADIFFDDEATSKFLAAMERYDPHGVFAGGEGLRLLGVSDVKYEIRRPSIETRIAACANCFVENDAECQSGYCCDSIWSWDCQAAAFSCTEDRNLPQGSKCSVDCNCASGACHWGKCR